MNYYKYCQNEGPLITLIHGLGEDHTIWGRQLPVLQESGYSTLVLDLEGHGQSPLTGKISVYNHVDNLESVLSQERIKKTNLVGFSLGGTVALEYTLQYPERVNKLCLINPGIYNENFITWRVKAIKPFLRALKKGAKFDVKQRKKGVDLSKVFFSNEYVSFLKGLQVTNLEGLYANLHAFMDYGKPEWSWMINQETLIVRGEKDRLLKSRVAEFLHQLPNSHLIRLNGSHVLMLSNTREINKILVEYFQPT